MIAVLSINNSNTPVLNQFKFEIFSLPFSTFKFQLFLITIFANANFFKQQKLLNCLHSTKYDFSPIFLSFFKIKMMIQVNT